MLQIAPFRALHYNPARISFISRAVAPPYDLIDPHAADQLRRQDEHNVVRLILGKEGPTGRGTEEYKQAAATFAAWRKEGVLAAGQEPAVYVCEQAFALDGQRHIRHGLICAVLLEEFSSGHVLPHERTMAGPRADRLRLMEACGAGLSQVFGVYTDPDGRADSVVKALATGLPYYEFTDAEAVAYRVWRVIDQDKISDVASLLRPQVLFIADGHHRYEAALQYRALHRAPGVRPGCAAEDFLPVFCVSTRNAGLRILPTHRLAKAAGAFDRTAFMAAASQRFAIGDVPIDGLEGLKTAFRAHVEAAGHIGCYLRQHLFCSLSLRGPELAEEIAPGRPAAWCALPVTQLHYGILEPLLGIPAESGTGHPRLEFAQAVEEVYWGVESGRFDAGFLLPPIAPPTVEAIARSGLRMPPKSTFFYPKIVTGLAFYPLDLNNGLLAPAKS